MIEGYGTVAGGNMKNDTRIKTFVIDTNVFIHKPDAILSFKENEVVVPLWVLEELDKLKSFSDERGRNARHAIRFLDRLAGQGDIHQGVKMENGSILKVLLDYDHDIHVDLIADKPDNKILLTALTLQKRGRRVFFVSKDINARVKATALGLKAVDYEKQKVNISELYQGFRSADISPETYRTLQEDEYIPWNEELKPNEFVLLHAKDHGEPSIGRYDQENHCLKAVFPIP